MRTPQVPTLAEPKLIDWALNEIQEGLTDGLPWLNHAFGKCQAIKQVKERRTVVSPNVYVGKEEYLKVFPDSHIGNFSFFVIGDESLDHARRDNINFKASFGLVVWFDYRKVYPNDWQNRSVDNVKSTVISLLRSMRLSRSQIKFNHITEQASSIYKEFTDKEIEDQFLMRPYGGFRVNGEIVFFEKTPC